MVLSLSLLLETVTWGPAIWSCGSYLVAITGDITYTLSRARQKEQRGLSSYWYQVLKPSPGASQVALVVKNLPANEADIRDVASVAESGRSPGGGHGNPFHYSCLENPRGQRTLAGYSPWSPKESDMTERQRTHKPSPEPPTLGFLVINSKYSSFRVHMRLSGKESAWQCRRCRRHRFDPWIRKIPWSRKWQPIPLFLPGKFHGQTSLVGYSP